MPGMETSHILLATLGGQPQVVTFTLDLLLQRGIPIRDVIVVHPAEYPDIGSSIDRLSAEFPGDIYKQTGRPIRLRRHVLRIYDHPLADITDEQSANGALNAMDELIYDLKQQQHSIHFSITGGRRLMGFLSFSAALLNFGPADHLWHIHTPREVKQRARNGTQMHALPEDNVRLIEVPFARLAQPILLRILSSDPTNARNVMSEQEKRERAEQQQHCRNVVERISPTQHKVLRAFARGLHPQDVASELQREITTINSHTHILLRECRNVWDIPERKRLDFHFLHDMFADYFTDHE
ncbi:MAG TPA: CRISPR-associated ring nuclease [Ktedonobacteraceae bacterium]|jgi:CRISPR-associated protein Csx14|nr:CRISPR-associated ring nuclease [Ktedonobacteraceae bacterium]